MRCTIGSTAPVSCTVDRLKLIGRWGFVVIAAAVAIAFVVLVWQSDRARHQADSHVVRVLVS